MRQMKAYPLVECAIAAVNEFDVVVNKIEQQVVLKDKAKNNYHRRYAKNSKQVYRKAHSSIHDKK